MNTETGAPLHRPSSARVGLAVHPLGSALDPREAYSPDRIGGLVRNAILEAGLGRKSLQAPLADVVPAGGAVIVKPNWVYHHNSSGNGMACMITHPNVVLAALREVAAARPRRIVLGDAPIQSCLFQMIVTDEFRRSVQGLAKETGVDIEIVDFRRTVVPTGHLRGGQVVVERPESDYVLFDLGQESLLEPVSGPGIYRVGDYDPEALARTHGPGRHQYLLWRGAFEADAVLSLPKLKTHCKAGLTGALKNLVGFNGAKEYLPHYRSGGSASGGDGFKGRSSVMRLSEVIGDRANRRIDSPAYVLWRSLARALRLALGRHRHHMGGAWHGNDTCWRMVIDLNRILLYGKVDGTLANVPQRQLFSLTDAVVCGEGNGPLRPEPCPVGAVTFSECTFAADRVHSLLLGFDPERLALTRETAGGGYWPIAAGDAHIEVWQGGQPWKPGEVPRRWGVRARPASGWAGAIELPASSSSP